MRGRVLSLRGWMRLATYGLVAIALVLTSLHIHRMGTHSAKPATPVRAPIEEMLHELAHCRDSGAAAQDDKTCIGAWEENQRRFFQEGRVP